jgi:cyclin A
LSTFRPTSTSGRAATSSSGWTIEFSQSYHLPPGTLHRAVSYVDRVLSVRALSSYDDTDGELRLLGAAALFTAAKYESSLTLLDAAEVAGYCGSSTTAKEVADMERDMPYLSVTERTTESKLHP